MVKGAEVSMTTISQIGRAGAICTAIYAGLTANAQAKSLKNEGRASDLQSVYSGQLASEIISAPVQTKDGRSLGKVRNFVVRDNGKIQSLITEKSGIGTRADFVMRIPWNAVERPSNEGSLTVDLAKTESEDFSLFAPSDDEKGKESFRVTSVIGDYVRLQTGRGYGYVSDVVFGSEGVMLFILVTRDEKSGGGTFAFPYPGQTGKWDARLSYYGLPYVTEDQATASAVKVDLKKLTS